MEERSTCRNCKTEIVFGLYNNTEWYHRATCSQVCAMLRGLVAEPVLDPVFEAAMEEFVTENDEVLRRLA